MKEINQPMSINITKFFCLCVLMFCISECISQCANTDVSTIAGEGTFGLADGPGVTAQFKSPFGVVIDAVGNIIIADVANHRIRSITPTGEVSTIAGDGTQGFMDGPSEAAQFNFPRGVAIDGAGNIIVADSNNNRIRSISPTGEVSTIAGNGSIGFKDGPGATAEFFLPRGVAIDGSGNIIVADFINNRIRSITPIGQVTTIAGSDFGFMDGSGATARFRAPTGVAIDGVGNIIVADQSNHRIRSITPSGIVSTLAGDGTQGFKDGPGATAQFNTPVGVAIDGAGNIIVADGSNKRIRSITPSGDVSTLAGDGTQGFKDGPGATAKFFFTSDVVIDGAGNIIVVDSGNNRIRKIGNCTLTSPQLVPTLGEWSLIDLSILLLIIGVVGVRQRVLTLPS